MFFPASKLFWFVATPSNLLPLLALVGVLAAWRWRRAGLALATTSLLLLLVGGLSSLSNLVVLPLEERFPPYRDDGAPLAGIIVLGGAVEARLSIGRDQLLVNHGGERILALADLARRRPELAILYSGGPPNEDGRVDSEADAVARFAGGLGLAPGRLQLENRSRNTRENALFSAEILKPQAGQRWLLVTSAFHMARAVGCYRAAGFDVVAHPVDYRTAGPEDRGGIFAFASEGLGLLDLAAKEWVGLLAYRLAGYTDALYPSPAGPSR